MGHERIGILPKTRPWKQIVEQMAASMVSEINIEGIITQTLTNVRSRFRHIHQDKGVLAAFQFIVTLSVAASQDNPIKFLSNQDIHVDPNASPISLARAVSKKVQERLASFEYGDIAQSASIDAIAVWYDEKKGQRRLFDFPEDPFDTWRGARGGSGFCELSRLFFAKFTERYLNYFLERAASSQINSIDERQLFRDRLQKYVDVTSKHAFEMARITQSFAAGWFNKHAVSDVPSERELENFLSLGFGKIRDELLRESLR
jgi:hypothetical protein